MASINAISSKLHTDKLYYFVNFNCGIFPFSILSLNPKITHSDSLKGTPIRATI